MQNSDSLSHAISLIHRHEKRELSNPKVSGPGAWYAIHTMAAHVETREEETNCIRNIKLFCNNFKCLTCRGHAQEYIKQHPMEPYLNVKDDVGRKIGLFKWTWIFHNFVNTRLGKPYINFPTAYSIYTDSNNGVCMTSCGEEEESIPVTIVSRSDLSSGRVKRVRSPRFNGVR